MLLEKHPVLKGFYWGLSHLEAASTQLDREPVSTSGALPYRIHVAHEQEEAV